MKDERSEKRIETKTSRTAEWTCLSRAVSSFEVEPHYRSDDSLASKLVPAGIMALARTRIGMAIFKRCAASKGIYEYVIARTKYIDAAFRDAPQNRFEQIVIFGAGFDTRALRFQEDIASTQIFELDVPTTQNAKIRRYEERGLTVPANLHFVPMDFDRQPIRERLSQSGFRIGSRGLFILEGVLMYLLPSSVVTTFQTLEAIAGTGSLVVFDYVRASVLRGERTLYGEAGASEAVKNVNEQWTFGLEPEDVESFLSRYEFKLHDHQDASGLERLYFTGRDGTVGHVNGTHCIVTAERV